MERKAIHQKTIISKGRKCNKFGHTYRVRHKPPTDSTEKPSQVGRNPPKTPTQPKKHQSSFVELDQAFGLFTVKSNVNSGILVNLSINETPITMTLDTEHPSVSCFR